MKDFIRALGALKGGTLLLTHHNADVDAAASALGLRAVLAARGIGVDLGVAESLSKPSQKLPGADAFRVDPDCAEYDNVILIETSVPEQLASVKNVRADAILDHHPPGKLAVGCKNVWIDENYKSCCQMVLALARQLGFKVDREFAFLMAAGLMADTAHLRMAGLREFEDMVELLKTGVEFSDVLKALETPIDVSERIAVLKAASRMEAWKIGDLLLVTSYVASHEAAACRSMVKMGADAAVVVAKRDDEVRISSRGREKILKFGLDLSVVFKEVGRIVGGSGGGHDLAGSANGPDKKAVEAALKYIRKEFERAAGKQAVRLD